MMRYMAMWQLSIFIFDDCLYLWRLSSSLFILLFFLFPTIPMLNYTSGLVHLLSLALHRRDIEIHRDSETNAKNSKISKIQLYAFLIRYIDHIDGWLDKREMIIDVPEYLCVFLGLVPVTHRTTIRFSSFVALIRRVLGVRCECLVAHHAKGISKNREDFV